MFILSDDHSKNAISCYGNTDIQTPGLDRLAAEGMRFNHALTPNSFCTPARAVVLTGKYSHRNGVTHLNQSFDGSQPTFPKLLQAAGYSTALFGKWHLLSEPTGFDHYCVMKMQGMAQNPKVWEPNAPWVAWSAKDQKSAFKGGRRLQGYNNDAITDEALNWLENRDQAKPFCMLLHPKPPHAPYSPAKRYEDFLKDVFIPEPATLLDDYEGRTPAAISATMRSNRIILNPVFKVGVVVDLDNEDAIIGLLEVDAIQTIADRAGSAQACVEHQWRHLRQRERLEAALQRLPAGVVLDDLPVFLGHQILHGKQRFAAENADAPVKAGGHEFLRDQHLGIMQPGACKRLELIHRSYFLHASGKG